MDTKHELIKPIIIGITGGSGSGKSCISDIMKNTLLDYSQMSLDNYAKPLTDKSILKNKDLFDTYLLNTNFDEPESYNIEQFITDLVSLKSGNVIRMPVYDHATTTIVRHIKIKPARYIIIDGLFLLSDEQIRNLLDIMIYVDADDSRLLSRRISRDIAERNGEEERIKTQYYT